MARQVKGNVVCPDCRAEVGTVKSKRGVVIRQHTQGPLNLPCLGSGGLAR